MGIYIKGLDWPELGMPITITIFNNGAVNEEGIADYQAIKIKTPHGRLIDAHELNKLFTLEKTYTGIAVVNEINCALTVIEAEGRE